MRYVAFSCVLLSVMLARFVMAQPHAPAGVQNEELLQRKTADVERLRREVNELRQATGKTQQVVVQFQILEVSLTRTRMMGLPGFNGKEPVSFFTMEQRPASQLVQDLCRENIAKLVAEPTLVTTDGKPAHFLVGGGFPVRVVRADKSVGIESKTFGDEIDVTTTLLGNNRVHLYVHPRVSSVIPDSFFGVAIDGKITPAVRIREIVSAVEGELGTTMIIGGPVEQRTQAERNGIVRNEVQTLFLVTAEQVVEPAKHDGAERHIIEDADQQNRMLEKKLAALNRLLADVEQLRQAAGKNVPIVLHVQVLDLSVTKMQQLGFDLKLGNTQEAFTSQSFDPKTSGLSDLFEAMRREKVVNLIEDSVLVTLDGHAASLTNGGEVPSPMLQPDGSMAVMFRSFGTKLEATASLLPGGRTRIALRSSIDQIEPSLSVTLDNGTKVPGFRSRAVNTGFDVDLGKAQMIYGLSQERRVKSNDAKTTNDPRDVEQVKTVILITPRLAEPRIETARVPANAGAR